MGDQRRYEYEIKTFLEKSLSCTNENKSLKELQNLLNDGAKIRIKHVDLTDLLILKRQGIEHLTRMVEFKNQRTRFVISLISGVIGAVIGAGISIVSIIAKSPPPC